MYHSISIQDIETAIEKEYKTLQSSKNITEHELYRMDFASFIDYLYPDVQKNKTDNIPLLSYFNQYNNFNINLRRSIINDFINDENHKDVLKEHKIKLLNNISRSKGDFNFLTSATYSIQPKKNYTFTELTQYHGEKFVKHIYQALLRRTPDAEGMQTYLDMLNKGVRREQIILHVHLSEEARKQDVKLKGVWLYRIYFQLLRIPIAKQIIHSKAIKSQMDWLHQKYIRQI